MIKTRIYIDKYDWWVNCYIAVTHYDIEDIIRLLWHLGCDGATFNKAKRNLRENNINTGLTYSSFKDRESVMVTSLCNDAKEQFNTICHEIVHVCVHISNASYVDKNSEEFAYMVGDLSMVLYPKIKNLLCECCRNKI